MMPVEPSRAVATAVGVRPALRRLAWHAEGREDAFRFALEMNADLTALRERQSETTRLLSDPHLAVGPMVPNAGPRLYREGYLAGLQEAIALIAGALGLPDEPAPRDLAAVSHASAPPAAPE
jgi:hypothetical protein